MSDTPKLEVIRSDYQRDAREVLEDAIAQDFETVVVLGLKGGHLHIRRSKLVSTTLLLGTIEQAKNHIFENQSDA